MCILRGTHILPDIQAAQDKFHNQHANHSNIDRVRCYRTHSKRRFHHTRQVLASYHMLLRKSCKLQRNLLESFRRDIRTVEHIHQCNPSHNRHYQFHQGSSKGLNKRYHNHSRTSFPDIDDRWDRLDLRCMIRRRHHVDL